MEKIKPESQNNKKINRKEFFKKLFLGAGLGIGIDLTHRQIKKVNQILKEHKVLISEKENEIVNDLKKSINELKLNLEPKINGYKDYYNQINKKLDVIEKIIYSDITLDEKIEYEFELNNYLKQLDYLTQTYNNLIKSIKSFFKKIEELNFQSNEIYNLQKELLKIEKEIYLLQKNNLETMEKILILKKYINLEIKKQKERPKLA